MGECPGTGVEIDPFGPAANGFVVGEFILNLCDLCFSRNFRYFQGILYIVNYSKIIFIFWKNGENWAEL